MIAVKKALLKNWATLQYTNASTVVSFIYCSEMVIFKLFLDIGRQMDRYLLNMSRAGLEHLTATTPKYKHRKAETTIRAHRDMVSLEQPTPMSLRNQRKH